MNRRNFLKRGAMAALGTAIAVAAPSLLKPEIERSDAYAAAPLGIPAYVTNDHCFYYQGARFVVDVDCPEDTIYFMDMSRVRWEPDGMDGSRGFATDRRNWKYFGTVKNV